MRQSARVHQRVLEHPVLQHHPTQQQQQRGHWAVWFTGQPPRRCSLVAIVKLFPSKTHQHESPLWRQGRPLQRQRKKPWPKKSWAGTARPPLQNPGQVSQCVFGYHCHGPEWLAEEDLSHVSLPRWTMQAKTKHSLWSKCQCEKAEKQSQS